MEIKIIIEMKKKKSIEELEEKIKEITYKVKRKNTSRIGEKIYENERTRLYNSTSE